MRGLTSRKSHVSGRPVTTQVESAWPFHHTKPPESLAMGLAPMLGENPGSGQSNRHIPSLPVRSRNGAADTLLHQGRPTAGISRFPPASGPGVPIASSTPPRTGGMASPGPLPASTSSPGPPGATPAPVG